MARLVALFLLSMALIPTVASAQQSDDELARHFFETGRTYFSRAEYQQAAEAFGEAYRLSGRPALLVNQARALEAAGDLPGAIRTLEQASSELDPGDDLYPTIAPKLERLRAQQAHAEAEAAARQAQDEDAEETETEELVNESVMPSEPVEASGPGTLFWVGIGSAALGGALLVTSLITGVAAHGVYSDLEGACPGDVCPPDRAGDIDRGNALGTASTVLLFVGAVAAAAGVTLILLDGGSDEEQPEVALSVGPGAVRLDGRF